jgi:hypothetical protein
MLRLYRLCRLEGPTLIGIGMIASIAAQFHTGEAVLEKGQTLVLFTSWLLIISVVVGMAMRYDSIQRSSTKANP